VGAHRQRCSRSGLVGTARQAHYSAAKAGLIGLTRSLAKELGPDGVLVNAVAPTTILTATMRENMTHEVQERMAKSIRSGASPRPTMWRESCCFSAQAGIRL